jgi:hypothetical protein
MANEEREAEHQRDEAMLQRLAEMLRKERQRDPIAWEVRAVANHLQRAIERQTSAWERAMTAIEHAANAWEAKANDQ